MPTIKELKESEKTAMAEAKSSRVKAEEAYQEKMEGLETRITNGEKLTTSEELELAEYKASILRRIQTFEEIAAAPPAVEKGGTATREYSLSDSRA